jgi:hypothetical protein
MGGGIMEIHNVQQTLQFGPVEKKLKVLGELNGAASHLPLADIQDQLEALAFVGGKTQIRLYALRAMIVLGERRDSVVDALTNFFGEDLFTDENDNIIHFPWVPADLPTPEEGLSLLPRRLKGNISYTALETLSRAAGSDKAASFLGKVLNVTEDGELRVLCIYAMGALGHPTSRTALEYYRDNMGNTPEGRAAEISLQYFGTAPVFGLLRKHAEKHGQPTAKKGGCFVITAVSGNESSFEVFVFRTFRDTVLAKSTVGNGLVRIYYSIGPGLARAIECHPLLRRLLLTVFVRPAVSLLVLAGVPQRALRAVIPKRKASGPEDLQWS